jgi:hypothetical protein
MTKDQSEGPQANPQEIDLSEGVAKRADVFLVADHQALNDIMMSAGPLIGSPQGVTQAQQNVAQDTQPTGDQD